MSLYPSLEDMKVDHMIKAQESLPVAPQGAPAAPALPAPGAPDAASALPYPVVGASAPLYPWMGDFMGMELSENTIRDNMPEYIGGGQQQQQVALQNQHPVILPGSSSSLVAPVSGAVPVVARTQQLSHGIRQAVLCKDAEGKIGIRVKSINKGIFVCLVTKGSAAAMGGLRFGDQILQINGENMAGYSENKVHDIFRKAGVNNIVVAVRDRPFERTLTLHKDSTGHLGFQYKDGKITAIAVNSSAARNGLLVDHNLLEINGQNVIGLKDKEVSKTIDEGGQILTVTVIPNFLYQHMVKNMSCSLVKKMMDHSNPDM